MDQLEKIIRSIREDAYEDGQNGAGQPHSIDNDKRAIKKLIKELVAEAKPPYYSVEEPGHNARHDGIEQYETNLLKVLGYEDEK